MTQPQFRTLIVASLLVGLLGGTVDLIFPSLVPDPFHAAQTEYDEKVTITSLSVGLLFGIPGVGLALAGSYGLFFFRKWAPRVTLVGTALALLAIALFGPAAQSGLATALAHLSSYLWGASVLLPFVPQYRAWFQGEAASSPGEA